MVLLLSSNEIYKWILRTKIKTLAYFGLIRPLLEYAAATTWDPYMYIYIEINIRKIEMVQWQAACFIVKNYNHAASVGEILDQLGWKSLQSRRKAMRLSVSLCFIKWLQL